VHDLGLDTATSDLGAKTFDSGPVAYLGCLSDLEMLYGTFCRCIFVFRSKQGTLVDQKLYRYVFFYAMKKEVSKCYILQGKPQYCPLYQSMERGWRRDLLLFASLSALKLVHNANDLIPRPVTLGVVV
jgi:hypothetical protein